MERFELSCPFGRSHLKRVCLPFHHIGIIFLLGDNDGIRTHTIFFLREATPAVGLRCHYGAVERTRTFTEFLPLDSHSSLATITTQLRSVFIYPIIPSPTASLPHNA